MKEMSLRSHLDNKAVVHPSLPSASSYLYLGVGKGIVWFTGGVGPRVLRGKTEQQRPMRIEELGLMSQTAGVQILNLPLEY